MDSNTIPFITFIIYFILYFFVTQKLYNSKYFYVLDLLLISAPFAFFFFYLNDYTPQERLQKFVFILSYYGLVLMAIKLLYKTLNQAIVKRKWLNSTYEGKDYTFVTHANRSGKPVWDQEASGSPSWFDFMCSYCILFLPMIFILLSI